MNDVKNEEEQHPLYYTERFFRELYSPRTWITAFSVIALLIIGGAVTLQLMGEIEFVHLVWVVLVVGLVIGVPLMGVLIYQLLQRTHRLVSEIDTQPVDDHSPARAKDG